MIRILLGLCLAASLPFQAAGNSKAKRLNRIEDRLARIEARQDHDSISRREDITDLALRMDDVETLVNSSAAMCQTGYASSLPDDPSTEDEFKELVANGMLVMQTAIAEVKARSHRDASEMQTTVAVVTTDFIAAITDVQAEIKTANSDVKQELKIMITGVKQEVDAVIDDVKTEIISTNRNAIDDVKQEMNSAIRQSDRLETSIKAIQDKLDNIDKRIADIESKQSPRGHVDTQSTQTSTQHAVTQSTQKPVEKTYSSCLELYRNGVQQSGTYDIHPAPGSASIKVFCDMETDGGGWTVFQRRQDGSVDFNLEWDEYALGFGDLGGEFWLGNDYISSLTSGCYHELRVDLWDFEGNSAHAKYNKFKVLSSKDNYRLEVSGYSGNASGSLSYHSGYNFSTKDRDNDAYGGHCAQACSGAWWYSSCHHSNLNSVYLHGTEGSWRGGVSWYHWKNSYYSMKRTEMKFREI